jgi:hypothetical protein
MLDEHLTGGAAELATPRQTGISPFDSRKADPAGSNARKAAQSTVGRDFGWRLPLCSRRQNASNCNISTGPARSA